MPNLWERRLASFRSNYPINREPGAQVTPILFRLTEQELRSPPKTLPLSYSNACLFPIAPQTEKLHCKRYAEKRSILDSILAEAKSLQRQVGKQDQKKLDEYLTSVRETEQRVERLEQWIDVPKPDVSRKDLQLNMLPGNAHDRPMWLDVMLELSYLAFITDTTRVIAFEWSREAGGYGGGGENHHELSHHGGDAGMLEKLASIDRFPPRTTWSIHDVLEIDARSRQQHARSNRDRIRFRNEFWRDRRPFP